MSTKHVVLLTLLGVAVTGGALSAQLLPAPSPLQDPCSHQADGQFMAQPDPCAQAAEQGAADQLMAPPDPSSQATDQEEAGQLTTPLDPTAQAMDPEDAADQLPPPPDLSALETDASDQPADFTDPYVEAANQDSAEVSGDGQVELGFFYTDLAPDGQWVQASSYGLVWSPYGISSGWQPYTLGHWLLTNFDWTWISDERFGWATYHYGRWISDPRYGWIWVPGYQWGPAWVAWRAGGGYIGWAPLPPTVRLGTRLDRGLALPPSSFCFVEERLFLDTRLARLVVPPSRNAAIIRSTTKPAQHAVVNSRVVDGVAVQHVEQVTGRKIKVVQVSAGPSGKAGTARSLGGQTVFHPTVAVNATAPPLTTARVIASPAAQAGRHQQESRDLTTVQAAARSRQPLVERQAAQGTPVGAPAEQALPAPAQQAQLQRAQEPREVAQQLLAAERQQLERQRPAKLQVQQARPAPQQRSEQQQVEQRHQAELQAQQQRQAELQAQREREQQQHEQQVQAELRVQQQVEQQRQAELQAQQQREQQQRQAEVRAQQQLEQQRQVEQRAQREREQQERQQQEARRQQEQQSQKEPHH
jgi:hypothetical protein